MKTTISIPNPMFDAAEQFAKHKDLSRSQLYAVALREYFRSHKPDQITQMFSKNLRSPKI